MAKTMTTLSLNSMANLSRTTGSKAWKMCAPAVMGVILSVILVITTITTPTMVTTFLKLALPHGRCLLRGHFDHERGVHTLMIRAACFHGAEGTMGSFALALDDLQRLYLTLPVIGSWANNARFLALALPIFAFRARYLAFSQPTLSDNGLRYIMI